MLIVNNYIKRPFFAMLRMYVLKIASATISGLV